MTPNPKPKPPLPGGEFTFTSDTGPQYIPPGIPRVNLIPVGDGGPGQPPPPVTKRKKRKPLLPSKEEIARLPRTARAAFEARCAQRARTEPGSAADAAVAILRQSSDPGDLLYIRRDFDRFAWLARKHGWTDDTPVSPDLVGPLWPPGRTPRWARETKPPRE